MPEGDGAVGEATEPVETGTPASAAATQHEGNPAGAPNGSGADPAANADDPFAKLEDPATREWAQKQGLSKYEDAVRKAHEQEKFIGGAVRVPGEDASEEDRSAFAEKVLPALAPKSADEYKFTVPKDLPPDLPYDEAQAAEFKSFAKEQGLTTKQAAALHDKFISMRVSEYNGQLAQAPELIAETAKQETAKLEKLWGPADGDAARTNAAFADKVLSELGHDVLTSFQKAGLVGPNKEMLSADLGVGLAKIGAALFKEDDVLRGDPSALGNPFAEGPHFNLTQQMQIARKDPDHAKSLIAAAGKRPEDFGLRG